MPLRPPPLGPLARYLLAGVAVLLLDLAVGPLTGHAPQARALLARYVFPAVMLLVWLVLIAEARQAEPADQSAGGSTRLVFTRLLVALAAATLLTALGALPRGGAAGDVVAPPVFVDSTYPPAYGWPWPFAIDLTGLDSQDRGWVLRLNYLVWDWLYFASFALATVAVAWLARRRG